MKTGVLTFLLFFAVLNSLSAQGFTRYKWQVGAFITPKIDYRIIKAEGEDEETKDLINAKNENDKARLGLDVGLACIYNFTDKTRLKAGIEFIQTGFHRAVLFINYPDSTLTFQGRYNLFKATFFKMPVGLRYTFYNENRSSYPFIEANIKPAFRPIFQKYIEFNISTSLTLGYSFSMVHHDQTYLGLTFDYFLKEFPESNLDIYPFSIGLEIGFIFW